MVNSKAKGNNYERSIANMLSARFADYLGIDKGFRRNADSGSYFGGKNAERMDTHDLDFAIYGDLICPKDFKWSIECKHYKTAPSLKSIITANIKQWDGWLEQVNSDALKARRLPLLIVRYNGVPDLAITDHVGSIGLAGLSSTITYKSNNVYLLEDLLGLPDSVFFRH